MAYTKQDVQQKTETIRRCFKNGQLSSKQIAQYESLVGWHWGLVFMPFAKARTLARAQQLANLRAFWKWKKPVGMPSAPARIYKTSGWAGYGDFLGNAFMSFTKARTLARAQQLANFRAFWKWKKPVGMPSSPHGVYKNSGWLGYGDFLGTGNPTNQTVFFSFTKARTLARAQHFTNQTEFKSWNRPVGMPSNPNSTYKNSGWTNWYDFLGNKKGQ